MVLALLLGAVVVHPAPATNPIALPLRGQISIHDPSTVVRCQDRYWIFGTGQGVSSKYSTDRVNWLAGPPVFARPPAWVTNAVPGFRGSFWAPDLLFFNGQYHLYYAVSTWGSKVSAIGLATNPTLDPENPEFRWTDRGMVIRSVATNDFNTIDPAPLRDAAGNLWLSFGSYWSGIKLVQLNPAGSRRLSPDAPIYSLASHPSIEAPYLYRHGGYYYLFVNWGSCCQGTNSTYNIRVGRSTRVTGPYFDRDQANLLDGGGSLFLGAMGRFIGPGHIGIFSENGSDWFSYHFYDADHDGAPTLNLRRLDWSADGWPVAGSP